MRNRICVLLFAGLATPAAAHVTLPDTAVPAASTYIGLFRVGHGCSGSPTTALRIAIPDAIASAKPQPKPGWTLEIERSGDHVTAITWKGGSLPSDQFDEFAVLMKLPAAPGRLTFPAIQTCAAGVERWVETPAPGTRAAHPAPTLDVMSVVKP